ncbi:MAG: hypothetical protein KatS3mg113_0919 [Planctomycetaceae bacterium]|nr:MAG: hypothetical protein KatS3mg113_0919 [Planctomycetaceae bacterium]
MGIALRVIYWGSCGALLLAGSALAIRAEEPSDLIWEAGVAKAEITPPAGLWMAGYGGRTLAAEGTSQPLYVRALALRDRAGHYAIVVATDTLGLTREISAEIYNELWERHQLPPACIMLNASHTHCGPVLRQALYDIYPLDEHQHRLIDHYSAWFTTRILETIEKAITHMQPVTVYSGYGMCQFAVNRRTNPESDVPRRRELRELIGPQDHSVPVLSIRGQDGSWLACVFAYACHNTVLSFNRWHGDYAGCAQLWLEQHNPGMTALFVMGCGGDQNPIPRRSTELAEAYGEQLGKAVAEVLGSHMKPVISQLQTERSEVLLPYEELPSRERLLALASREDYAARWARRMLLLSEQDEPVPQAYPYPLSVWKLGSGLTWISLGGEVVVDYGLKFKGLYGWDTWVTAYAHDVMAYIPTVRIIREGGYEGQSSMMVYGLPSERWQEDIEEILTQEVDRLLKRLQQ